MQTIKDMYNLIRRLTSRKDPALKTILNPDLLSTRLLNGIMSSKYLDDAAAAQDLFPDDKIGKRNYRQTKYNLIQKLITLCFFLNLRVPTHPSYTVNAYRAKREVFVAELLEWFRLHEAYKFILSRTIRTAETYQLTEVLFKSYSLLRNYHSKHGSAKDCEYYAKKATENYEALGAELQSGNIRALLWSELSKQSLPSPERVHYFLLASEQLAMLNRRYHTRTLSLNYYLVAGMAYRLNGDFAKAFSVYQENYTYLCEHPGLATDAKKVVALFSLVRCCLFSQQYESGNHYAQKALELEPPGTYNWFCVVEAGFLLSLHDRKIERAAELFEWAITQSEFRRYELLVEKWSIYEGYLRFLLPDEQAPDAGTTVHGDCFSFGRLFQEIDETRSDKLGLNIAIQILQVLQYLRHGLFDLLDSRITAVQNYLYTYLRGERVAQFERTECLFRMFLAMRAADYDPERTQERAAAWLQQMTNIRPADGSCSGKAVQIEEIVPYEYLWSMVLRELQRIADNGTIISPQYNVDKTKRRRPKAIEKA